MLTVVIDTNVLLQCPPLATLDRVSIDPDGVCIVIPVAVLSEIDNAKASGSTRRAKKAREISSMFNDALNADKNGLPLKPGSSSRWEFGSGERAEHGELDTATADHRIVAEALALTRDNPNLVVLTGDTMARLLAQRVGLKVRPLPESWRLSAEADPRDKRIRDLEQRVNVLEKTRRPWRCVSRTTARSWKP
jgi:predicted ribonuclease YlaK